MAVGHALRDARESRGLSLDQIAGETHIPRHFLESIERDEFDQLPAPVYVRGFIRAYAGFLRMSAALLIDQLPDPWRQQGAPVQVAAPVRRRQQQPESDSWLTDWDASPAVQRGPRDTAPPPPVIPAPEVDAPPPLAPAVAPPPVRAIRRPSAPATPPLIDDLDALDETGLPADGVLSELPRRSRPRVLLILAGAVAAVSAVVVAGAIMLDGSEDSSPPAARAPGGAPAGSTPTLSGGAAAMPSETGTPASPTASPAAEPSPEPSATSVPPSPTPAVEAAATAVPPASAFAYCESLGGGNFACGPSPWRVICTPTGPFFDPAGVIPRPIPAMWAGWSETTLTGRLENIWTACA